MILCIDKNNCNSVSLFQTFDLKFLKPVPSFLVFGFFANDIFFHIFALFTEIQHDFTDSKYPRLCGDAERQLRLLPPRRQRHLLPLQVALHCLHPHVHLRVGRLHPQPPIQEGRREGGGQDASLGHPHPR